MKCKLLDYIQVLLGYSGLNHSQRSGRGEVKLTSCSSWRLSFLKLAVTKPQMNVHLGFMIPAESADEELYGHQSFA